jgi:hypothetical protein
MAEQTSESYDLNAAKQGKTLRAIEAAFIGLVSICIDQASPSYNDKFDWDSTNVRELKSVYVKRLLGSFEDHGVVSWMPGCPLYLPVKREWISNRDDQLLPDVKSVNSIADVPHLVLSPQGVEAAARGEIKVPNGRHRRAAMGEYMEQHRKEHSKLQKRQKSKLSTEKKEEVMKELKTVEWIIANNGWWTTVLLDSGARLKSFIY